MNVAINNKLKSNNFDFVGFFKKFKKILNYIGKIISGAVIVLLVMIGLFLAYYVVSMQMYKQDPSKIPMFNLYTIISGSMEPNIRVYDVVFDVKPSSPEDIKVGDVITFTSTSSISQGLLVTHRVQDVLIVNGKYEYVTKGDYNPAADSATAKYDDIIGKVAFKIPQLGRIQFFVASKAGWFFVVLLPAMGVIVYDVIKLVKLLSAKNSSSKVKESMGTSTGDISMDNVISTIKKNDYQENLKKLKSSKMVSKKSYLERLNNLKMK